VSAPNEQNAMRDALIHVTAHLAALYSTAQDLTDDDRVNIEYALDVARAVLKATK
jgi:hypothetical protein